MSLFYEQIIKLANENMSKLYESTVQPLIKTKVTEVASRGGYKVDVQVSELTDNTMREYVVAKLKEEGFLTSHNGSYITVQWKKDLDIQYE